MYDTHCHPYLAREKNSETITQDFFDGWGTDLNSIAVDLPSSQTCVDLAKKYSWVHATIGIHPTYCQNYKHDLPATIQKLRSLYQDNSNYIVAIWECGLDYYWLEDISTKTGMPPADIRSLQKDFFIAQIQLARELSLPIVIHNRESGADIFEVLRQQDFKNFVFHCFSENLEFAQALLEFAPECKLGFWGITTFKNAHSIQKVASEIPLKNILIETDSPYLTPSPYRGKQENEPLYVKYVLEKIIDLRSESPTEVEESIMRNSKEFFV